MKRREDDDNNPADLDELIEEITLDAYGEDEKFWAFRQAFEDEAVLPADGFIIGEPVSVIEIDYDGNERRGLTAKCRREDGFEYVIAASDLEFPEGSAGERYVAAYRKWLGIEPCAAGAGRTTRRRRRHKAKTDDVRSE